MLVKENICRTLSRCKKVWTRNSKAFKEWRGYERRSVSLCGRKRTKFEFSFRRKAEEVLRDGVEFGTKIIGNPMVGDVEETPCPASFC